MPLTQYAITGSLRDALDAGPQTHGTVLFVPYGSHDSRVEDDNVLLGSLPPINIADMPDPYLLDEGAWTVRISTTSKVPGVGGRPVFQPISVAFTHDGPTTWADIVEGAVTPVPITPTLLQQAEAAADEAEAWATAAVEFQDTAVETLVEDPASATRAALSATYVATAAAPTGTAATDAAALDAAHTALPAEGGAIRLRRGTYNLGANTVTFTKPVTLIGEGGALTADGTTTTPHAITTIVSTSATADCLVFAGKGNTILDLAVVNEAGSTPTAGTGIKATGMSQSHMARVTVLGFYNCVETRGVHWTIDSCHIYDPVNYGLWGNNDALGASYVDHGDYGVINCIINTMYRTWAGVAGFKWTGGGGIRWVGNKINGGTQPGSSRNPRFQYGAHIEATAATGTTGELTMTGGGIANCTVACVRVTQSGAGAFIHTKINGMQLNSSTGTCVGVHVGAASAAAINQVRDVTISDNTFNLLPGSHIVADYVTGLTIGTNHHSSAPTDGTSPVVRIGDGTVTSVPISVNLMPQGWPRTACLLLEDWRSYGNNNDLDGRTAHDYEVAVRTTAVNTDQTLFRITPTTHGAVLAELAIEGYNWSSGRNFVLRQVRAITRAGTGSAVQSTLGTDLSAGTAAPDVLVSYDAATVAGEIAVKWRTTNASFPSSDGKARLILHGTVQKVRKGA